MRVLTRSPRPPSTPVRSTRSSCPFAAPAALSADEGLRRGGSLEKLATLTTPFKEDGVIHAGNASQISDGTGALLITTSELARREWY